MGGRPSEYNQEIGDLICSMIATTSKSLKTICAEEGMPDAVTLLRWVRTNEEFRNQYTRAKEEQADYLAEEILEIADDGSNDYMTITKGDQSYNVEDREVTNRSKLRVEARKWIASKLKPKKYGDKVDVTTQGKSLNNSPVTFISASELTDEQLEKILKANEDRTDNESI